MSAQPSARSSTDSDSRSPSKLLLAEASLLSVAIIWGVNIPLMKTALALTRDGVAMHPYAFNAIRLVVSAVVLLLFAAWEFRGGVRPAAGLSWLRVVIYAVIVSGAYQLLFLLAVSRATSADISLIMATVPMWTALAARLFLQEKLARMAWIGLWIAFTGTMIVTLQRPSVPVPDRQAGVSADQGSPPTVAPRAAAPGPVRERSLEPPPTAMTADTASQRLAGNVLSLIAALAWAGGTVFSRPLLKSISPTQLSACSATIGLPFHLLLAWSVLPAAMPMLAMVPMQLSLLYSGVLSTGLALAMWSFGVKVAGSAQAAVFQNLTPVFAISAAWLWRGEPVTGGQIIGGSMIIGGLILMRRSRVGESQRVAQPAPPDRTSVKRGRSESGTVTAPSTLVADTALPGAAAATADA